MSQSNTNPMVQTALNLLTRNPDMPAKEILLRAMVEHTHTESDFESVDPAEPGRPHPAYSDETHPPAPFAELLRRAYAPSLDPREVALMCLLEWPRPENQAPSLSMRIDAVAERWEKEVVEPFLAELEANRA